jgi:hypothetical protein
MYASLTLTCDLDHIADTNCLAVVEVVFCPFAQARISGKVEAGHLSGSIEFRAQ